VRCRWIRKKPEGFQNPGSRCGAVVLVYQAAEPVTAPDLSDRRSTGGAHWVGRLECESAVGRSPFYDAAREPKQIWEVPDGQHIAGITTRPEEYERRVIGFFDDALLDTR
jgi:hypothetical protein